MWMPWSASASNTETPGGTITVTPDRSATTSKGWSSVLVAPDRREALDLQCPGRPGTARPLDRLKQRFWSAAVDRGCDLRLPQRRRDVDEPGLILGCDGHPLAPAFELVQEGHRCAGPAAVGQLPVLVFPALQLPDHGDDRRDPDAAGDEHVPLRGRESKRVSRAPDLNHVTFADVVVDPGRPTTAVGRVEYRDAPGPVAAAQGVLACASVGQQQIDVCAGLPVGEGGTGGIGEGESYDVVGVVDSLGYYDVASVIGHGLLLRRLPRGSSCAGAVRTGRGQTPRAGVPQRGARSGVARVRTAVTRCAR